MTALVTMKVLDLSTSTGQLLSELSCPKQLPTGVSSHPWVNIYFCLCSLSDCLLSCCLPFCVLSHSYIFPWVLVCPFIIIIIFCWLYPALPCPLVTVFESLLKYIWFILSCIDMLIFAKNLKNAFLNRQTSSICYPLLTFHWLPWLDIPQQWLADHFYTSNLWRNF